ncbi:MAG: M56 family metallopeptidase, partial [Thermoanaerobaculia bacterium]
MRELIVAYVSNAVWQVAVIGSIGLILGRRRRFSLLALTLVACAIVPALTQLPSDASPIVSSALPSVPARGAAMLVHVYLTGLAFCALRLMIAALRAARIVATSRPLSPGRRLSHLIDMPVTIGRTVFLPPPLMDDPPLLSAALAHEDAHVRRNDYLLHLALELIALPLYFHPVTHLLRRAIAEARELACDDEAAAQCGNREYAAALVEIASLGRRVAGMSMAASSIERRVIALLQPRQRTNVGWRYVLLLFIIAGACTRFD